MNDSLFLAFMAALVVFWTWRIRAELRQQRAKLLLPRSSDAAPGRPNALSTGISLTTTVIMALGTIVTAGTAHWNVLLPWLPISAVVITIVAGTAGLIHALFGRSEQRSN